MWGNWCIRKNGYLNIILYKYHLNHGYLMEIPLTYHGYLMKNPHGNHQHQHAPRRPMAVANQRISALPWPRFFLTLLRLRNAYPICVSILFLFCKYHNMSPYICIYIYIYCYCCYDLCVYIYIHTLFIYFIMITICISVYIYIYSDTPRGCNSDHNWTAQTEHHKNAPNWVYL
jgi:hypothetical protein